MVFYRIFSICTAIVLLPILLFPVLLKKKYRVTVKERLAITSLPFLQKKSSKPYVWIHALSVGEVNSAIAFVKKYKAENPDVEIVFSASTRTGFATAKEHLAGIVELFLFPYDFSFSTLKRIKEISPVRVIIVETDIWPGFLCALHRKKIPVYLINARLSDRSFRGYMKLGWIFKKVFSLFTKILTQTQKDSKRFEALHVVPEKIAIAGNIKYDQDIHPLSQEENEDARKEIGIEEDAILFVAGSTHPGEEKLLLEALAPFFKMKLFHLMIAPRDPERAKSIKSLCVSEGYSACFLSQSDMSSFTDVFIVDSFGKLMKLYGMADIVFVGGSLLPFGGHNPLEAAGQEKPVLFGSNMSDFASPSSLLVAAKGGFKVASPAELTAVVKQLIDFPEERKKAGSAARTVFLQNQGAVERTIMLLKG